MNRMLRFLAIFSIILVPELVIAQTNISGTITRDSVWTTSGSPYIITGSTTVAFGATLTIQPDVEVKFAEGTQLTVTGSLVANSVTFTTNEEASKASWNRIYLNDVNSNVTISNSTVQFADNTFDVYRGTLTLSSSTISDANKGIYLQAGGNAVLNNTTITSTNNPVYYSGTGNLTLNGTNDFTGNEFNGIYINISYIDNDLTLPYASIPYYFPNDVYVRYNSIFTIAGNNILKFYSARRLEVQDGSAIHAVASEGESIIFTSWRNDNEGGDTNNDGVNTSPKAGDWNGIRILGHTSDTNNILKRVEVSFAGMDYGDYLSGLTLINSSAVVDSSKFFNNYIGASLTGTSNPVFKGNEFGSNSLVPVALTFDANPAFTDNIFSSSNNLYDAIGLLGSTISGTHRLVKRDFTSIPNVTYLLLGDLKVATGASLEIEEGIVIKVTKDRRIEVLGTLTSVGTEDSKIEFTSYRDDNVGNPNDTNKDGNGTSPANEDWDGLFFGEDADASILSHTNIRYAANYGRTVYYNDNNNYYYPQGALNLMNADITISDCEIANTRDYAIDSQGNSKPVITNNAISNTGSVPVALALSSDPTFSGNTLSNVGYTALGYVGGNVSYDSYIRNRNFAGYDNITNILLGSYHSIAPGTKLTIEPGTVMKVGGRIQLIVNGTIDANGTPDNPITFTSLKDDNVGNPLDTNGDGNTTAAQWDNWGAIRLMGDLDDANSSLSYINIKYGKHGIIFRSASPAVADHINVLSCRYFGMAFEGDAAPVITNTTIQNCGWDPVALSTTSNPVFNNVTFNSNGTNGIGILEAQDIDNYYANQNYHYEFFEIRDHINSDAKLSPKTIAGFENVPYIVRDTWYVQPEVTLSIEPDVIIKGKSKLYVDGALKILGTENKPVTVTSGNDDSIGGDTNNNGSDSSPDRGEATRIHFRSSSIDATNVIKHLNTKYAEVAFEFESSEAKIDSSSIELTKYGGINIFGSSSPTISNTSFLNIAENPVYMDMFANPVFTGNTTANVGRNAIGIRSGTWGTDATVPFRNFAGIDSISYHLYGQVIIPSGTIITIPAGMIFKGYTGWNTWREDNPGFKIEGALIVDGTEDNPIIFTADTDDTYGRPKDTNDNGKVNDTFRGSWPWLDYTSTSDDSLNMVNHAIFSYKNVPVRLNSANPSIRNSYFEKNNYGIQMLGVSTPAIENNVFHDLAYTPIRLSLVAYPKSTVGNVMSGTTWRGIGVNSEILVQDVTLPKRNFAGRVGIPYVFLGNYTIGTGAILTINPGVIIKQSNQDGNITVNKGLIALGKDHPDSLIVFTSIDDDFYGGDTDADSNAYAYPYGEWAGIRFTGTALDASSILDHTVVRYARYSDNAAILADNASPTITNSKIYSNKYGVKIYGSGNPIINNCDIYANSEYGIYNRDLSFTIDATNNWWGKDSGPTHASNIGGTGDKVSDSVNFLPFKGSGSANPVLGDVSMNGSIQPFDASILLQAVAGLETLTDAQLNVADVSGNGDTSAMDASYILQYVVKLISTFPAELNSKVQATMLASNDVADILLKVGEVETIDDTHFAVPLVMENVNGLYAFEIELNYSDQAINLDNIEKGDLVEGASFVTNDTETGILKIAMAATGAVDTDGTVAKLHFIIKDKNISSGIHIVRFSVNEHDKTSNTVGVDSDIINLPTEFELLQNYPNPFNPSTVIGFNIPEDHVMVRLEIYNILGQKVCTLVNDFYNAGRYRIRWNGLNDAGTQVSTGMYLYRIKAGNIVQTKKLTFIK